jgi:hypothetical protein
MKQQAAELRRFARTRPNFCSTSRRSPRRSRIGGSERDAVLSLARRISEHFLPIELSPAMDQPLHWADGMRRKLSAKIRRHLKRELGTVYADRRRLCATIRAP